MALTLESEQRLDSVGLVAFFDQHRAVWQAAAQETYNFLRRNFPQNAAIRHDDVAKALNPILEVNHLLRAKLDEEKLRGKYWISDFADLIIERTWQAISGGVQRHGR
jgi:hypothetical protein